MLRTVGFNVFPDFEKFRFHLGQLFGLFGGKISFLLLVELLTGISFSAQPHIGPGLERVQNWLDEQLEKEATFRLIVSGQQVFFPKSTRFEAWTKIGNEQQRLFDLIKKKKAEGVIFVTGDQHYAETLKSPKALGYDAWEFMFGGVNQEESPCKAAAVYRVDKAHSPNKSASIVFNWGTDPTITFQIHNEKWEQILSRSVKRSQLKSH